MWSTMNILHNTMHKKQYIEYYTAHSKIEGPFMFQKSKIQKLLISIYTSFQGVKLWTPLNNQLILMQNI